MKPPAKPAMNSPSKSPRNSKGRAIAKSPLGHGEPSGSGAGSGSAREPGWRAQLAGVPLVWVLVTALIALAIVFWAYGPAMRGGFVFDDTLQQYALPDAAYALRYWIVRVRPVLMFTYWVNSRISGFDTYSFHVFNVLFHCITTGLIFLIVRYFVTQPRAEPGAPGRSARYATAVAGLAALLFLFHPVQTESVAYIIGRSECLSALFSAAAYAVFLYRPKPASWGTAAAVLALFAAAVFSKEQAIVLPALFLFTDLWWASGSPFRSVLENWRIYLPMAAGGVGAVALFWRLIMSVGTGSGGGSAGFGMKDLTWYQYLFTQFRAIFVYLGTFLFPVNLTLDWDFAISKTIFDRGSLIGLVALLALAAAAWHYRRSFPLASFGFFVFLLLLSPTSSILPIKDPVAERRLYLPMLGLLLILVDLAPRLKAGRKPLAAASLLVLLAAAGVTRARAEVWSTPVSLWEDTVRKSPNKARGRFQLGSAYYDQGRFAEAEAQFQKAAQLEPPDYSLLLDWGLAYDGLNQPEKALVKLRQAAALEPRAQAYTQIAKVYGERAQWKEALDALAMAEKLDPYFTATYAYRGLVHLSMGDPTTAVADFERALAIDRNFEPAIQGLTQAQAALRAKR